MPETCRSPPKNDHPTDPRRVCGPARRNDRGAADPLRSPEAALVAPVRSRSGCARDVLGRVSRDLERDRAAIGVADKVDRSGRFSKAVGQGLDLFRQSCWHLKRPRIVAIAGDVGSQNPMALTESFGEMCPLPARTERAVQGDYGACHALRASKLD